MDMFSFKVIHTKLKKRNLEIGEDIKKLRLYLHEYITQKNLE